MQLNDVLTKPMTEEEYLAYKRELMKDTYGAVMEKIREKKTDEAFVRSTLAQAKEAMTHRFVLPGTDGVPMDVGNPPAWHECRSGDAEYTWVLNRHQYFTPLVDAYLLTGERAYAEQAIADLEDWIDQCPCYPVHGTEKEHLCKEFGYGVNPWRSFEAGVRMSESWRSLYEKLLLTDLMTPHLHARISLSAYEHAQMLVVVAPILHPDAAHNHYLVQMQGVLDAVCLFPEWEMSKTWLDLSVQEVVRCALFQFTDEGGQIEGSPGYHSLCLTRLFSIRCMADERGFTLPAHFTETMNKASEYMCYVTPPSGITCSIGDTGIGRIGETAAMSYYEHFGELGVFRKLYPLLSNTAKERLPADVRADAERYVSRLGAEVHFQHGLGHYMARTGWGRDASHVMFCCHTPVNNGHSHQDPLTFTLALRGYDIVIDPSCYTYQDNVSRYVYKSPAYHSCLTFGHRMPFYCTSSWGFTRQRDGHLYRDYRLEDVMACDGAHDNYLPSEHRRLCALVGDDLFLVADRVHNDANEDVTLTFHVNDPTLTIGHTEARGEHVRILWAGELQVQAIDAAKAPGMDRQAPTRRLVLEDRCGATDAQYLTVFTTDASVKDVRIEEENGATLISYEKGGVRTTYRWRFNESLTKEA